MVPVQFFLILVTGLLVPGVTSQSLDILEEPIFAEKDDNVTLTCRFSNIGGSTTARFKWYHENSLVSLGERLEVVDTNRLLRYSLRTTPSMQQLTVTKVILSDGGDWTCEPTIGTSTFRTDIHLVVKVPPSLVNRTPQAKWTPQLGSSFELYCNASGNPTPTVTWTGDTGAGGIVLPDGTVTEYFIGNVLKFVNAEAKHHGKYICHASNGLKTGAYAEYTVNLPHPPRVSAPSIPVQVRRNQMAEIGCVVNSFPRISSLSDVIWRKDGNAISNNQNGYEYTIIEGSDDSSSKSLLQLPKVDSSVRGEYTCEFTNSQGTASASMTLEDIPAINSDTGATTSGVVCFSGIAYLNLVVMAIGVILRFIQ